MLQLLFVFLIQFSDLWFDNAMFQAQNTAWLGFKDHVSACMDIWSKLSSGLTLINIETVASGLTATLCYCHETTIPTSALTWEPAHIQYM